jgi:hypothetical protein
MMRVVPKPAVRKHPVYRGGTEVCRRLREAGFEAFFVGGAVRDLLLMPSLPPLDIDIATSATPDEVSSVFPGSFFVGKAFGVSLVRLEETEGVWRGHSFEVATFRTEGSYSDARHPDEIAFGTRDEDSCRRDFTMNALYFDPLHNRMIDPHGGVGDIKAHLVRAVGSPEVRFREDALRIVRLFRFAATCRMQIHPETLGAAVACSDGLARLSRERLILEFSKVGKGKFERFVELLAGYVSLAILGKGFPVGVSPFSDRVQFPKEAHRDFPLLAFSIQVALMGEDRAARFLGCSGEFASWPLSRAEKRCFEAVEGLLRAVQVEDTTMFAFVLQRFVQKIGDVSCEFAALLFDFAAILLPRRSGVLSGMSNLLRQTDERMVSVLTVWRRCASVHVDASFRARVVAEVKELNFPDSAIAAWLGLAEGVSVFRILGINDSSVSIESISMDTARELERIRGVIRI